MKKTTLIFIMLMSVLSCGENIIEKSKVFGLNTFSSAEWKSTNIKNKSKMVYSFLKMNDVSEMDIKQIYSLLGQSTAYYEYDAFPAYNLMLNEVAYIIAFPIDRETNKISKIVFKPRL